MCALPTQPDTSGKLLHARAMTTLFFLTKSTLPESEHRSFVDVGVRRDHRCMQSLVMLSLLRLLWVMSSLL